MYMFRDDGLIYGRVLRGECSVKTRLDLYARFPPVACRWGVFSGPIDE